MITWQCKLFPELTNEELYKILQLRAEVFIVEQNCVYQDCDSKDFFSYHFTAWDNGKLLAYTRLLPIGVSYADSASIGRVITAFSARGQSLGKQLMERSIEEVYNLFGEVSIKISAQVYLKRFYESFSFISEGNIYLEDGIEHIAMKKRFPSLLIQ
ncbi:MAG: GNAT family N-acetyltransferase [Ginsengibacter sp.]